MSLFSAGAGYFQVSGNDELRACCTSTIVEGLNRDNALTIVVSYSHVVDLTYALR